MNRIFIILASLGFVMIISCGKEDIAFSSKIGILDVDSTSANLSVIMHLSNSNEKVNKGVTYGLDPSPHPWGAHFKDMGEGIENFTITLDDLSDGTVYYARSYAYIEGEYYFGDEISFRTDSIVPIVYNIGDTGPAGGIVFYVDGNGSGMEVDDTTWMVPWGCQGTSISNLNPGLGHGESNTINILQQCNETGIAAEICANYISQGFDDWFLPSKAELAHIYNNVFVSGYLDIPVDNYLTSNELTPDHSTQINFANGLETTHGKNVIAARTIPVRNF